jgi:hypothetical protein
VNAQVVPEVIQALVDDGLVDSDKIGGGNFYWAVRRLVQSCVQSATSPRLSCALRATSPRLSCALRKHDTEGCKATLQFDFVIVMTPLLRQKLPSKQGQRKRMRLEALRANISAAQGIIEKENALRCTLAILWSLDMCWAQTLSPREED